MDLTIIVAMSENRVIGRNNDLPWKLPRDLDYVRQVTKGKPLIMGRKNHESIGRPLPKRRNIVLTRDATAKYAGCEMAQTVEQVFELIKDEGEVFVFGGEEIYRLFLPYVNKMHVTILHHQVEGDTHFPEVDETEWKEVSVEQGIKDEANPYDYSFHIYERARGLQKWMDWKSIKEAKEVLRQDDVFLKELGKAEERRK